MIIAMGIVIFLLISALIFMDRRIDHLQQIVADEFSRQMLHQADILFSSVQGLADAIDSKIKASEMRMKAEMFK